MSNLLAWKKKKREKKRNHSGRKRCVVIFCKSQGNHSTVPTKCFFSTFDLYGKPRRRVATCSSKRGRTPNTKRKLHAQPVYDMDIDAPVTISLDINCGEVLEGLPTRGASHMAQGWSRAEHGKHSRLQRISLGTLSWPWMIVFPLEFEERELPTFKNHRSRQHLSRLDRARSRARL